MVVTSSTMGDYEEKDNKLEFILQQMSGQQHSLYEALREIRQDLASMHLGALMAFYSKNPDRLAQAAHSLRELMEKLPEYLDVPMKEGLSLGEKVKKLAQAWKAVVKPPEDSEQSRWSGTIDVPLQTFLIQVEEFFSWQESNRQSRTHKKLKALRQLDPIALSTFD
jgi:hypothetical protein